MYSIGLDISKATINVYIPINDSDIVINNDLKSVKSLYSKLKKYYKKETKKLIFVFEPTGSYSFLLKKFCSQKEIKSFIVNPRKSSNFAKVIGLRNKNDEIDARMLSQMIITARESEIKIPIIDEIVEDIKDLIVYYKLLTKQKTQNKNQLEAINTKDGSSIVIKNLKQEIKLLIKKEKDILLEIKKIIAKDEKLHNAFLNIQTIKSVGEISAIVLLHHFIQYPNANQKQIVSLVGLDPTLKESGTSVRGKSKVSKSGSKLCRGILFMAVLNAVRNNEELKSFYNRLKDNGKHTTVAQIAVMRKIVVLAFTIYKNNEVYDEERFVNFF